MGKWSRAELEEAFEDYQRLRSRPDTGDWDRWADSSPRTPPTSSTTTAVGGARRSGAGSPDDVRADQLRHALLPDRVVHDRRGSRLGGAPGVEPHGRPRRRQHAPGSNFTLLKYAGDGKWSYEEDIYNPAHFKDMIRGYMDRKRSSRTDDSRTPTSDGSRGGSRLPAQLSDREGRRPTLRSELSAAGNVLAYSEVPASHSRRRVGRRPLPARVH